MGRSWLLNGCALDAPIIVAKIHQAQGRKWILLNMTLENFYPSKFLVKTQSKPSYLLIESYYMNKRTEHSAISFFQNLDPLRNVPPRTFPPLFLYRSSSGKFAEMDHG